MESSVGEHHGESPFAGLWIRLGAALVDWELIALVSVGLGISFRTFWPFALLGIPLGVAYSIVCVAHWGQTLGMALAGVRVTREDGTNVGCAQATLRFLAGVIATVALGIGLWWIAFDARKQGWHDRLAGTLVRSVPCDLSPSLGIRLLFAGGILIPVAGLLSALWFVVPSFAAVFADLGIADELPFPTRGAILVSSFLRHCWLGWLLSLSSVAAALSLAALVGAGRLPLTRAFRNVMTFFVAIAMLALIAMFVALMLPLIQAIWELRAGATGPSGLGG